VTRNFACRAGEIDLVMRDGGTLVFVEVRYRRSTSFGGAAMSVTRGKQLRIVRAAGFFLLRHPEYRDDPCRFDVVAIEGDRNAPIIGWIAGAFSA
jgi:putative endonuclease